MSLRKRGRLSDKPVFGYQATMERCKFYLTCTLAEGVNGNSIVYYLILHSPDFITVFAGLLQYCPPVMPSHATVEPLITHRGITAYLAYGLREVRL